MKKRNFVAVLLILVVLAVVLFLLPAKENKEEDVEAKKHVESVEPIDNEPEQEVASEPEENEQSSVPDVVQESQQSAEEKFLRVFDTPFEFYGKVVDHNGSPVENAEVDFSITNKPFANALNEKTESNGDGLFSLKGNGAGLGVRVSKIGYYATEQSRGVFRYGIKGQESLPTQDNPAVFVLRKEGEKQSLVKIDKRLRVSRNGSPVEIDLETGKQVKSGQGDLRIEAWTYDQQKDNEGHYDWKVILSVNQGGLVLRENRFDFSAPEEGYSKSDEISMLSTNERWSPQAQREYFVKLSNDKYARIAFRMVAGGDNFFTLKSSYNPSGSRNLE